MIRLRSRTEPVAAGIAMVLGTITCIVVVAQPPERPPMYQAFTPQARDSIAMSIAKAKELSREETGTDFLLWALVANTEGNAAKILQRMNVPLDAIRLQAEAEMAWSNETDREIQVDEPTLSEGAKRVLELAADEARQLPGANKDIETEHLLLGLLRYKHDLPFSYTVLRKSGITLGKAREQIIKERRE